MMLVFITSDSLMLVGYVCEVTRAAPSRRIVRARR
jgi:hypothetical protein